MLRPAHVPGYAAIVELRGEHDIATARDVRETLESIRGNLLIDLSTCTFFDSSIVRAIVVDAHERRRDWHCIELLIPATNATVLRTAQLSGLSDLLTTHGSIDGLTDQPSDELDVRDPPIELGW